MKEQKAVQNVPSSKCSEVSRVLTNGEFKGGESKKSFNYIDVINACQLMVDNGCNSWDEIDILKSLNAHPSTITQLRSIMYHLLRYNTETKQPPVFMTEVLYPNDFSRISVKYSFIQNNAKIH